MRRAEGLIVFPSSPLSHRPAEQDFKAKTVISLNADVELNWKNNRSGNKVLKINERDDYN